MLVAVKESVYTSIPRERSDRNAFWPLLKGNLKIAYESSRFCIRILILSCVPPYPGEDVTQAAAPLIYP